MVEELTFAERAAEGAALLDEQRPGWVDEIDPDRLDMADPDCCILGQLGGYVSVGTRLGLLDGTGANTGAIEHGFEFDGPERARNLWHELEEAWRGEIAARV
jgi:hypothetical protein